MLRLLTLQGLEPPDWVLGDFTKDCSQSSNLQVANPWILSTNQIAPFAVYFNALDQPDPSIPLSTNQIAAFRILSHSDIFSQSLKS